MNEQQNVSGSVFRSKYSPSSVVADPTAAASTATATVSTTIVKALIATAIQ